MRAADATFVADFWRRIAGMIRNYSAPAAATPQPVANSRPDEWLPLVAYRERPDALVCKYLDPADEQAAFNAVAAGLYPWPPMALPMAFMQDHDFTLLPPKPDDGPTGRAGYIAIRRRPAQQI
jgi:hypothetical protein